MKNDSKNEQESVRVYSGQEKTTPERVAKLLFELGLPKFHPADLARPSGGSLFSGESSLEIGMMDPHGGASDFSAIFHGDVSTQTPELSSTEMLFALEEDINDGFEKREPAMASRLYFYNRKDEAWWFLIWRGQALKLSDKAYSKYFDSVVYYPLTGELQVRSAIKSENELYQKLFGIHLFGDGDYFAHRNKYFLEPLRMLGKDSLVCSDVDGLDWVKLTQISYHIGGLEEEAETHYARDLFSVMKKKKILSKVKIVWAGFQLKFSDSDDSRVLHIHTSEVAGFDRDKKGVLVDEWMRKRNFLTHNCGEKKKTA